MNDLTVLLERLATLLGRGEQPRGTAIIIVSLDPEVLINDSLRRGNGNRITEAVEARLRQLFEDEDTLARIGVDEFAVLARNLDGVGVSERVAARVLEVVGRPLDSEYGVVTPNISLGMAHINGAHQCPADVLRDGKAAMHLARSSPTVRYQVFDESHRRRLFSESTMRRDIVNALDRDELVLHYQPILRLDAGRTTAVEALLRWNHPTKGLTGPGHVIAAAEGSELIMQIGNWALYEAGRQAALWWSHDHVGPQPVVHVNISPHHLVHDGIVETVGQMLDQTSAPPESLCLEITETVTLDKAALPVLRELSDLGVSLSIDDFGTGHSSLSRLSIMPVDSVKLDRSFVTDIVQSTASTAIAEAVLAIGEALELTLIAEGIETHDQLNWLRDLGYEYGQGYLFARPMPVAELERSSTWQR